MKYKYVIGLVIACLICCTGSFVPAYAERPTASVKVEVSLGSNPEINDGKQFFVCIEALDQRNPLPDGCRVPVWTGKTAAFGEIVFSEPGEYHYRVYEERVSGNLWTVDPQVYQVQVSVTYDTAGQLKAVMCVLNEQKEKMSEISFDNRYSGYKSGSGGRLGGVQTGIDRRVPIGIGIGLILMGIVMIGGYVYQYGSARRAYAQLETQVQIASKGSVAEDFYLSSEVDSGQQYARHDEKDAHDASLWKSADLKIDWDIMSQTDVVAWLQLDDISYPIVKGYDNTYYLNHTYDGKANIFGSIFMDANNSADLSDLHTLIYGHYTRDGQMFGKLSKYKDETYRHHAFFIYTPDHLIHRYAFFSVAQVADGSYAYTCTFDDDWEIYQRYMKQTSLYETGAQVNAGSRLVTLSTCDGDQSDRSRRLIIQGIETGVINMDERDADV